LSRFDVKRYEHGSRVPGWDESVDLSKPPATIPDPALTPVPAKLRAAIEQAMTQYPDSKSAAIPALHLAQDYYGWCSPEAIDQVACVMGLTPAYLTSVASFYDIFEREQPRHHARHHVYVCTNISCSLRGGDELYEAMLVAADDDPELNVREFECLGACDIAPMASVDGEYVGPLTEEDIARIVEDVHAGRPVLVDKQLRNRPCAHTEAANAPVRVFEPPRPPATEEVPAPAATEQVPAPAATEQVPAPAATEQVPAPAASEQAQAPAAAAEKPTPKRASRPRKPKTPPPEPAS
jgi:NADH:ubiquinone oxidoreductase subunit E